MSICIGVVMDPITQINYLKDTTLLLLQAAAEKNWNIIYFEPQGLFLDDSIAKAYGQPLQVFANSEKWYALGETALYTLGDIDALLMRKDPPFDIPFLQSTFF